MTALPLESIQEVPFLTCGPLRAHGFIIHAFSTRLGGVSEPPYTSLNLGFGSGDSRTCVLRNRARFGQAVGINADDLTTLRQVHGNGVIVLTKATDPQRVQG